MKKLIFFLLSFLCVLNLTGCHLNEPAFKDFSEYSNDFSIVRDFISAYYPTESRRHLIVDLNDIKTILSGDKTENNSVLLKSVDKLKEKGFDYIEAESSYMIFWEDETGYYGILWSENPKRAINSVKASRPHIKSCKIAKGWYEIGALYSI